MHNVIIENIQFLRDGVLKEDWKQVRISGATCLGLASGAKILLENEGDLLRSKMDSALNSFISLEKVLKKIILSGDDEFTTEIFTPIREILVQFPDDRVAFEEAFEKLKNGKTDNISLMKSISDTNLPAVEPVQLTLVREIALTCASRGLLGLIHADFNLSLAAAKTLIHGEISNFDAKDDMLSIYNEYRNSFLELEQQLYQAMTQRGHEESIATAAAELLNFIERKLPAFSRSQAWMYIFSKNLKDKGKGGEAEEIGKIAAKSGQLTRKSVATHVSCMRIILELSSVVATDETKEFLSNSPMLPYKEILPNGIDIEVSKIGQSNDGDFVEISGFVTAHDALRTSDNKLISKLEILDPSSGSSAKAVAIFTQLAHTGVTIGAFCRISGIYRVNSTLLEGESGVEIDRLPLSEIAKDNWNIAFLKLSNRWYQAWRNGTNMLWGLGPQFVTADTNSELDDKASSFGAGELIFPPFNR